MSHFLNEISSVSETDICSARIYVCFWDLIHTWKVAYFLWKKYWIYVTLQNFEFEANELNELYEMIKKE